MVGLSKLLTSTKTRGESVLLRGESGGREGEIKKRSFHAKEATSHRSPSLVKGAEKQHKTTRADPKQKKPLADE